MIKLYLVRVSKVTRNEYELRHVNSGDFVYFESRNDYDCMPDGRWTPSFLHTSHVHGAEIFATRMNAENAIKKYGQLEFAGDRGIFYEVVELQDVK